jgi:hypothetical protein
MSFLCLRKMYHCYLKGDRGSGGGCSDWEEEVCQSYMKVAKTVANHSHGEGRSCTEANEIESFRSDI